MGMHTVADRWYWH